MTDDWKAKFLESLAGGSTVERAARAAGVHRVTAWRRRKEDKEFDEAWDQALESGTDILEEICFKRAAEHSDVLLMFLLKARRPDKFMERQRLEHVRIDYSSATEELERMAKKILDEDEEAQKRLCPPTKE